MAPPPPCSALALDIGQRRIGLAGCDPLGLTVTPLPALRRSSFEQDLTALLVLLRTRRVQALVLGLPLDDAGQPTAQARHCRRYGMRLAAALVAAGLPLPLAWVNEHSSSWEAGERYGLHGDRSGRLDSAAAALLLQQWLREGPAPQLPSSQSPAPVAGGPGGDPVATATMAADPGAGADPS
jgi:putative holliday junction resolvase